MLKQTEGASRKVSVMQAVTVHLVEDDRGVREALATMLECLPCAVLSHGSAEDFLARYSPERAECLVLDIGLPGMNGLELLANLRRASVELPTLVLSASPDVERVVTAIQRGAIGFLEKPPEPARLIEHIRGMMQMSVGHAQDRVSLQQLHAAHRRLTEREIEVFELLGKGLTSKQIAHELGLSIRTSHIHRSNVMLKFGLETQLEIVQAAARLREAAARATR